MITRPPSRTFIVSASAATNEYGPASSGSGAELLDLLVEVLRHLRHLRLRQPGDPEGLHQILHPPRGDAEQVAGRDHRGQRGLRAPAPLEQPLREVAALPQLRDRDVDGAGAGVEVTVPVPVATVRAGIADGAVRGAADLVRVRGQQRVDERG